MQQCTFSQLDANRWLFAYTVLLQWFIPRSPGQPGARRSQYCLCHQHLLGWRQERPVCLADSSFSGTQHSVWNTTGSQLCALLSERKTECTLSWIKCLSSVRHPQVNETQDESIRFASLIPVATAWVYKFISKLLRSQPCQTLAPNLSLSLGLRSHRTWLFWWAYSFRGRILAEL